MSQPDLKKAFVQKGKVRIVLGAICLVAGAVGRFANLIQDNFMTSALLIAGVAFIILGFVGIVLAKKKG